MFNKILVANRGEIAVRIIHACRELGRSTVAVYSTADKGSLHSQIADEAICIGPAPTNESYLNIQSILAACELTGADAVHPGFGFLSENSSFAEICELCGVKFIGPGPEAMRCMGDKASAKAAMQKANVPVIPGCGIIGDVDKAKKTADNIGYPVMVKAANGGGGRGIRKVDNPQDLEQSITAAQLEAKTFFGSGEVYIEKFIENPRHIEVQLLADENGHVVHLGERDCSMQRRNQKIIEESPGPKISDELREKLGNAAKSAATACGYSNAGTVEFLMDKDDNFYFLEMNTRIQVEHGITELVTGVDIVKNQIQIAEGAPLNLSQKDIDFKGHAIECRVNAENPNNGFAPSPGRIEELYLPCGNGIRVDSSVFSGCVISPYYDSMIAKVMAYAPTRKEAIAKMNWALAEFIVKGIDTNIDFLLSLLREQDFVDANVDIGFLKRKGY